MLAEAAHSVADTTNQVLLLTSLSFSERKPDDIHPFGYGKERFLWSFMAAIFIFVSGAAFSLCQGISELLEGGGESGGWSYTYAALVTGVLLALAGVALHQITGDPTYDALAAILIGCLLAVVAVGLWRDTRGLLIGEAALPEERETMRRVLAEHPAVDHVVELLTMALGPHSLLVAARLDLAPGMDSDRVEDMAAELDGALREANPAVHYVFLDPTSRNERAVEVV